MKNSTDWLKEQQEAVAAAKVSQNMLAREALSSINSAKELVELLASGTPIMSCDIEAVRCAANNARQVALKLDQICAMLEAE